MAPCMAGRRKLFLSTACFLGDLSCVAASEAAFGWPPAGSRRLQEVGVCTTSYPPQNCILLSVNSNATTGICVQPSPGVFECWDVCDQTRGDSTSYQVAIVPSGDGQDTLVAKDRNAEVAMMISRIRQGKNLDVSCSQNFNDVSDWCIPGHRCGGSGLPAALGLNGSSSAFGSGTTAHAQSIPTNQGLCVVDPTGPYGRACWDMCNFDLAPQKFSDGSPNAEAIVNAVRGGFDSKGASCSRVLWWPWVLGVLMLFCIAGAIAVFVSRGYASKPRRTRGLGPRQAEYDELLELQAARDAQRQEVFRDMEAEPLPPVLEAAPLDMQRDLPPIPEARQEVAKLTTWQGKIPGLDEPHLFSRPGSMQLSTGTLLGQLPNLANPPAMLSGHVNYVQSAYPAGTLSLQQPDFLQHSSNNSSTPMPFGDSSQYYRTSMY
eukprot:TRINITY_DN50020_c0_g1_i1.p1 TRINITY_DN50020_c0_g1~~TRINITY_DN50020_c0_g1_i1.p1  ORF type:complete len:432 (-),score=39.48 TRINITY_DN50020_c0_g1_i1:328-1623(-)